MIVAEGVIAVANDRMFLRNKITGKQICIAKHFLGGWYGPWDDLNEHVNELFEDHFDEFYLDPHAYELSFEEPCSKDNCVCNTNRNR